MLTKQEREEIAERIENASIFDSHELYRVVTGVTIPGDLITLGDIHDIARIILDLCDTSNMVELPRDKDGEVIRVGDTVYDINNIKCEVIGYMLDINKVILRIDGRNVEILSSAEFLTHKEPVTIKSLAQRIKHVLEDEATSIGVNPYVELGRIAEQLESLGDSND